MTSSAPLFQSLEPIDAITITTLVDNLSDVTLPDQGPAKRAALGGSAPQIASATMEGGKTLDTFIAEHGFSALVTVRTGEREHTILFDTGTSPDGVAENLRRLQLSPKDFEAIVLSHGHFDHTAGLDGLIRALGRPNLPVILHPDFWNRRRMTVPGGEPRELPTTSRAALQGAGFEIIEERQPSFLLGRSLLITGEVDRTTGYEPGLPPQEKFVAGQWQPDPLVLDDQAMIVHLRGKGLVVMTGCGHAGIINIVRYAQRLTGVEHVYAVLGGFHLGGRLFEPIIPFVCQAFAELEPKLIVPAHCTGWRAIHALAAAFPEAFIQNSVGTRYELMSEPS